MADLKSNQPDKCTVATAPLTPTLTLTLTLIPPPPPHPSPSPSANQVATNPGEDILIVKLRKGQERTITAQHPNPNPNL